ncbi:G-type lectin S-receptor-like serine/threonine-protein kinase At5g24080 [Syzygium oleosum]|uniref:G-type lectin S-receptor-like serine/threonine-protein kinase At5g24080 n=1 Tax=Syzygium oleosum TaxID=219896 RepID=UPI0011D1E22F|nr:G-type lectin S-receptor-like serine/threonine-protein kinase At5g24080 [Syzygium oleosum]
MEELLTLMCNIKLCASSYCSRVLALWVVLLHGFGWCMAIGGEVSLGSRLVASEDRAWVSDNGTFAFGFATANGRGDRFQLAVWFAQLPGDRTLVWSANRNSPVSQNAILELDTTGNLVLLNGTTTVWTSNTSNSGVHSATMSETGNFILYNATDHIVWQSFSHPTDTLLPNQLLTISLELTSATSPSHGGYYTFKMLQQPALLSLALTYHLPGSYDSSPEFYSNYSYWTGPDISNATGPVIAVLDEAGSFGIVYGDSADGAVYLYENNGDDGGLPSAVNRSSRASVLRRLILEMNGNLRLYRWDNNVNGSSQWVPDWAAVLNPCTIAGICGNGICNLDRSKTSATCSCLPGTSKVGTDELCSENSSLTGKCNSENRNKTSEFRISVVQQTKYHFSDRSVVANYSDVATVSNCGDACLSDCECVASVYGLNEDNPYCWVLKSLEFGGFEDPSSTLFVKVKSKGSAFIDGHEKVVILPVVVVMAVLIGLLCLLLYYNVNRRRLLRKAMESSLFTLSGAPMNFTYRDLQIRTSNFSQLIGTGGFGSVYKGSLADGTLVAVKKLDRVLPHGENEFIAEVNTIGSMHHMNLVRLCGYCSEGSQRLLVYEFMKNGSLDKWIFPPFSLRDRLLDWQTRFHIAIGMAQGIAYFHEQCRNRIIHCDIKPENILLDENFCPKVSDFGLAKLMGREHSHVMTMVRGTRGYLAPEWVSNRPITVKADVYSYGMLLLEIIGGRRNLDMSFDAQDFFYPGWAFKEMTKGTPIKVADRRLEGSVQEDELIRALRVAFWCIQDEVFMRPTMGEVVRMLEGSMEINSPPMPQTVLELVEEGLDQVHRAMRREYHQFSSSTITSHLSSNAACSYSTMSPR